MTITPWMKCHYCHKIVKVNKPIFGSMHICLTPEEIEEIERRKRMK